MLDVLSTTQTASIANATQQSGGTPSETVIADAETRKPNIEGDYASKFAKLTAKESALRKQESELKQMREEFARFKKLKQEANLNPESVLNEFGLSYEGLTKRMLDGGADDKYQTLEQRLAKIEQREKDFEAQEKRRGEEETYAKAISHLQKFCEENADEYEFVRLHNAYDDVIDLAASYYRETGRYMNFDEAAKHVEKHLESEAEKLAQSKKLQAKFFPQATTAPDAKNISQPSKTLSNVGISSAPEALITDDKQLMQRAIAAYRNAKKQ